MTNLSVWVADGIRISSSDSIESLLMDDFDLLINDVCYRVVVPPGQKLTLVGCDPLMLSSSSTTVKKKKITMGIALMISVTAPNSILKPSSQTSASLCL